MIQIRSIDPRRLVVACALALPGLVVLAGCGGGDDATGDDRFEKAAKETTTTGAGGGSGDGSTTTGGEPSDRPTTTAEAAALSPGESLLAAVAAFRGALGSAGPIMALEFTEHFPVGDPAYASLQSQDPAQPANVDSRDWRNGKVSEPSPVQLSGDGTLEENLYSMDEVNWDAVAAALPGAQALVEQKMGTTFEGSDGVTHVIVQKDLPFSANTVVRVYVDGGDRSPGGYVQYFADGTLDKVQA